MDERTMLNVSPKGAAFIQGYEKLELSPYYATQDEKSLGIESIGYGMTHYPDGTPVKITDSALTPEQASSMFAELLDQFGAQIQALMTRTPTQNEYDAMLSLAYNIGVAGFRTSTVLRDFNADLMEASADSFVLWDEQNHTVLPGLLSRRRAESGIFFNGAYPA